ncbi:MAG: RecQ family ATP-dependent DNA helicase [Bacteroidales bacterium]|nr:RecQ family ATP-dependent DNA helicase [Bacteroidales bacterium]
MTSQEVLKKYWGYANFRSMQAEIIQSVLDGNDTLGLLPTGGGKSICYQVPGIMLDGLCLVITPLIALMKDQVDGLKKRGIDAKSIYSGMHANDIEITINQAVNGFLKFLFVSPERLQTKAFIENFKLMKIGLIAVDEAHCISQWGYDFRPPYLQIAEIRPYQPKVPILALTATATPMVVKDIQNKLDFKKECVFQKSFERKNLSYIAIYEENKSRKLLEILHKISGTAIIYVRSRKRTKSIAQFLRAEGISAEFYHAGLDVVERDKKQNLWMRNQVRVMVATNAFGMGIDKPDVRLVIHIDIPDNPEAYFQEAGRGGRDENPAYSVILWEKSDIIDLQNRFAESFPSLSTIRSVYNALGNFFQIPVYSGAGQSYDFDMASFVQTYHLKSVEAWNSIKFLEREGYISTIDADHLTEAIMICCSHEELYRFQVENARFDPFIKFLLRSYSGLFTTFVNINHRQIAAKTNIPEEKVVAMLTELNHLKIIYYQPETKNPRIVYVCERLSEKDIYLSKEVYEKRKQVAQDRLDAMINYVSNDKKCRSLMLLEWFGETDAQRCGRCDVCKNRNRIEVNKIEFDYVVQNIKPILMSKECTLEEMVNLVPKFRREKVINVIRWLLENGKIIEKMGRYLWISKE